MTDDTLRTVQLDRVAYQRFTATNANGATINFGNDDSEFSPVELLLAAIGGCTAMDVDYATDRHTAPTDFTVVVNADKTRDETGGNRLTDITVSFRVSFPEGGEGDAARAILPRAVKLSHDKTCTVSRTVEAGTPVTPAIEP